MLPRHGSHSHVTRATCYLLIRVEGYSFIAFRHACHAKMPRHTLRLAICCRYSLICHDLPRHDADAAFASRFAADAAAAPRHYVTRHAIAADVYADKSLMAPAADAAFVFRHTPRHYADAIA